MSGDLDDLLARTEDALARAVEEPEAAVLARVRGAVRRRRAVRHAGETFLGVAAVAVVGTTVWFGIDRDAPAPAVTSVPSPSVSSSPSPTPTPAPTLAPTPAAEVPAPDAGPVTRAEQIDDATVVARIAAPRTGEVWTGVVPAPPDVQAMLSPDPFTWTVYHVGHRGDAQIYSAVDLSMMEHGGAMVVAVFEVDAAGARTVSCPSARAGDPCAERMELGWSTHDPETFYDSLTLPQHLALPGGWTLTTTHSLARASAPWQVFGTRDAFLDGAPPVRVLRDLGALQVVEVTRPDGPPGFTNLSYGVQTPLGSVFVLDPADAPGGDHAAITWDDGTTPPPAPRPGTPHTIGALSHLCTGGSFSVEDQHDPAGWRPAGRTPDGVRVHLPVEGGNDVSRLVRDWQEEWSTNVDETTYEWLTGAAAGYPYATDEAFLASRALYAVEAPGGQWQLRLRTDAASVVYECG
ncbi:hypothetical protein ACWFNE_10020 [Cellulomonas sp. NPDC055163]